MNIVQIGSNDCNDHVYEYALANRNDIELLLLIEPNNDCLCRCKSKYDELDINYHLINKAITVENNDFLTLYIDDDDVTGMHTSFSRNHIVRHNHPESKVQSREFPAIHINNLFEEYGLKTIDRLYIDAEGYDIQILNSIDYSKYTIGRIQFEYVHCDGPFSGTGKTVKNFKEKLKSMGYDLSESHGWEVVASKQLGLV